MMMFKNIPIQRKLRLVILLTSATVLLLTCSAFAIYEYLTFRKSTQEKISTLGDIIASNSTAALAFQSQEDANEILSGLKAEKSLMAVVLYDAGGAVFARYTATDSTMTGSLFPDQPKPDGHRFTGTYLESFHPVVQGTKRLGSLYLRVSLDAMYNRLTLYGIIGGIVVMFSFFIAWVLSWLMGRNISRPILMLAETSQAISSRHDYSVRATRLGSDEVGMLTDAFNQMLGEIEEQNRKLSEFTQQLEQKVTDRTIELQNANKDLESFSYSISHDLRAPLRAIDGYVNVFLEDYAAEVSEGGSKMLNSVLSNTKRMSRLIDDLLAFAKLGRGELVKKTISMKDMVQEVWSELSRMEEKRQIELVLHELPDACADVVTMRQVWVNLISNALKYSGKREQTKIEIGSESTEEAITYYIKDNGAGFDMRFYEKLFDVFQRLHTEKQFTGTGVGLAIVHRVISKHGGKVWAVSKVNEGACFYFSLPKNK